MLWQMGHLVVHCWSPRWSVPVLNLINQGDTLLGVGSINWLKVALTYIVPYCVSTYGVVSYRLSVAGPETNAS